MSSSPDPKSIFFEYVAESEDPSIEELCERHPEHADELRELWAEEQRILDLIGEVLTKDGELGRIVAGTRKKDIKALMDAALGAATS